MSYARCWDAEHEMTAFEVSCIPDRPTARRCLFLAQDDSLWRSTANGSKDSTRLRLMIM